MQPGHPPRIRACIERLATRLTVSRHIKEQNEKQVSELLQLACEVIFFCSWSVSSTATSLKILKI